MEEVSFAGLYEHVERSFRQVAEEKGLDLVLDFADELPASLTTDDMRLRQVIRNLLSNAFKFTDTGGVSFRVRCLTDRNEVPASVAGEGPVAAFVVEDTGIGIPQEKLQIIFEAFQQADGGASRRYGGTGLGLAISREIAHLLGGEIAVESMLGSGSRFVLYLPLEAPVRVRPDSGAPSVRHLPRAEREAHAGEAGPVARGVVQDDRRSVRPGDRTLLIVEDDPGFARNLLECARGRGFKGLVALTGTEALDLAASYEPDGITLDLKLPDMDGWVLLDRWKRSPQTRHVPIQVISAMSEAQSGRASGAMSVVDKPASSHEVEEALTRIEALIERHDRRLLLVEPKEAEGRAILDLFGGRDLEAVVVGSIEVALREVSPMDLDCVVLDLPAPDPASVQLLKKLMAHPDWCTRPVIVYVRESLPEAEVVALESLRRSAPFAVVKTLERLAEETSVRLHRRLEMLPARTQEILRELRWHDPCSEGARCSSWTTTYATSSRSRACSNSTASR